MTKKVPVAENKSVEVTRTDTLEVVVDTLGNSRFSGQMSKSGGNGAGGGRTNLMASD